MLTVSKRDITSGIGKELLGGCLLWVRFFSYQISLFFPSSPSSDNQGCALRNPFWSWNPRRWKLSRLESRYLNICHKGNIGFGPSTPNPRDPFPLCFGQGPPHRQPPHPKHSKVPFHGTQTLYISINAESAARWAASRYSHECCWRHFSSYLATCCLCQKSYWVTDFCAMHLDVDAL